MKTLSIKNLGQIREANITFGDLTVLIGPQASGKSILLQMLKLMLDSSDIMRTIRKYGFNWNGRAAGFLDLYFGEGMSGIKKTSTRLSADGDDVNFDSLLKKKTKRKEQVFMIPAQRVMTIQNGWPRNFMSYEAGDPYVVKNFSENLRLLMEHGLGSGKTGAVFPKAGRMKKAFRDALNEGIFFNATVELDKQSPKKRFVLSVDNNKLSYMAWSAGQREFMPLLLGLYWLMPSSRATRKEGIKWVVIEEPEMGLHPKAIQSLLLVFLELINRGYKVIVSTHSPVVAELCWVVNNLKKRNAPADVLFELFELPKDNSVKNIFKLILAEAEMNTYYFSRSAKGINVKDISSLDPAHEDFEEADWGGLTSFSTRAAEIISSIYAG